jgi:hypothetical protein
MRVSTRAWSGTCKSPEAGAETPALLSGTSISLPPGSVETAALRREQAPAPVSVSWRRMVQTQRVFAHDGIPAIELTIWRSRWPGRSPRRSSSRGGRGTIPFDGERSCHDPTVGRSLSTNVIVSLPAGRGRSFGDVASVQQRRRGGRGDDGAARGGSERFLTGPATRAFDSGAGFCLQRKQCARRTMSTLVPLLQRSQRHGVTSSTGSIGSHRPWRCLHHRISLRWARSGISWTSTR